MTVYLMKSLKEIRYVHRKRMVLANPTQLAAMTSDLHVMFMTVGSPEMSMPRAATSVQIRKRTSPSLKPCVCFEMHDILKGVDRLYHCFKRKITGQEACNPLSFLPCEQSMLTRTGCEVLHFLSCVVQSYIYTLHTHHLWQGNHQIYDHIRCTHTIYAVTSPTNKRRLATLALLASCEEFCAEQESAAQSYVA